MALEPGGKAPNILVADVMEADEDFFGKALEGFARCVLNQREVCTGPTRALIQESSRDRVMERAVARTRQIVKGNPLDPCPRIAVQASHDQLLSSRSARPAVARSRPS